MADGRLQAEWEYTAALLAMTANINRGKGGRVRKPSDFMPPSLLDKTYGHKAEPLETISIRDARHLFGL